MCSQHRSHLGFIAFALLLTFGSNANAQLMSTQERLIEASDKPYISQNVHFNGGAENIVLAGTLSVPKGKGPFPAILLLHGSGPNDRDERADGFYRRKFLVLADTFNRSGIAVLRYDKRGVGSSGGDYNTASFTDLINDAQAAFNFLAQHPDIDQAKIGILGDSEGGYIAPVLAAKDPRISYMVLVSSPAVSYVEIALLQRAAIARAEGATNADIDKQTAFYRSVFDVALAAATPQDAREALTSMAAPLLETGQLSQTEVDEGIEGLTRPHGFEIMRFDPQPYLQRLTMPVLVVQGALDLQVPANENLVALQKGLGHNPEALIVEMPGINHLLQMAKTGAPSEYNHIDETVHPSVLKLITDWVQEQYF